MNDPNLYSLIWHHQLQQYIMHHICHTWYMYLCMHADQSIFPLIFLPLLLSSQGLLSFLSFLTGRDCLQPFSIQLVLLMEKAQLWGLLCLILSWSAWDINEDFNYSLSPMPMLCLLCQNLSCKKILFIHSGKGGILHGRCGLWLLTSAVIYKPIVWRCTKL